ncbi:MAG TPA: hypothetical protein VHR18_05485 [Solirubrobacterales bacterium]|jgi:hypothetical protein|nr:hypothetical protein [Solirubrobacterales bacterium]
MANTKRFPSLLATCAIVAAMIAGVLATTAQAAVRHIDGTVVSKNSTKRTFKISTQSGTVQIKVNSSTEFERISGGFGGLRKGLAIEVDARTSANGLVAIQVEPQGGNGGGGGSDDSGSDDHGGHGGGADDGPNHT